MQSYAKAASWVRWWFTAILKQVICFRSGMLDRIDGGRLFQVDPNKRSMLHGRPDEGILHATTTVCVKHVSCSLEKTKTLIDPGSSFTDVLPERKLAVEADTKYFLCLSPPALALVGLQCSGRAVMVDDECL